METKKANEGKKALMTGITGQVENNVAYMAILSCVQQSDIRCCNISCFNLARQFKQYREQRQKRNSQNFRKFPLCKSHLPY